MDLIVGRVFTMMRIAPPHRGSSCSRRRGRQNAGESDMSKITAGLDVSGVPAEPGSADSVSQGHGIVGEADGVCRIKTGEANSFPYNGSTRDCCRS